MSEIKPELKQCSRCHSYCTLEHYEKNRKGEWFKLCNNCRGIGRQIKNEYDATHKEENKLKLKEYYEANKEILIQKQKEYDEKHREEKKQRNRKYTEQNPEKVKAQRKQYYETHREEISQKRKDKRDKLREKMFQEHPEKREAYEKFLEREKWFKECKAAYLAEVKATESIES